MGDLIALCDGRVEALSADRVVMRELSPREPLYTSELQRPWRQP